MAVPTAHPVPEYPKMIAGRKIYTKEQEKAYVGHFNDVMEAAAKEVAAEKAKLAADAKAFADLQSAHEKLLADHEALKAKYAATTEGKDEALQAMADINASKPSAADLDSVAAETKTKETTRVWGKKK